MVTFSISQLAIASSLYQLASASSLKVARSDIQLLFLNTAAQPLTAYVQKAVPKGPTTYLINCVSSNAADCTIHDATLTVNPGLSYDFHKSINDNGAMTIHCSYGADGRSPASCTTTVAGGPNGYEVTTAAPKQGEWAYLPVQIVDKPSADGAYTKPSVASPTAAAGDVDSVTGSTIASSTNPATSDVVTQHSINGDSTGAATLERVEFSLVFSCIAIMLMAQIGFFS